MAKDWQYRLKREKEKQAFQEFDDWSRQDLVDYILQLRSGLDEMQEVVKNGGIKPSAIPQKELLESDFKQQWSYPTKIAFLITVSKRPLTSEELHHLLLRIDNHYKDYDKPRNNLTVSLNRALKSGRIVRYKEPGLRGLFYLLPTWCNKQGELSETIKREIDLFK